MIFVQHGDDLSNIFKNCAPGEHICLSEGTFRVKTELTVPGVTVQGAGMDKTVIVWDDYAKRPDERGRELVTFRTWTLAVVADGVTMRDLCIANDALHPELKGQEVALTVYADDFTMERCRLVSTQDTLFLGPLPDDLIDRYEGFLPDELRARKACRQVFRDCLIEGTVDFIFGCGEALFDTCELRSLVDARGHGYVAAPSHEKRQERGFTFRNCRFTCEDGVEPGSIYLARPWRDYGLCVFAGCIYGPHISPLGFDKWNDTQRDRTARFYEDRPVPGRVPWVKVSPADVF